MAKPGMKKGEWHKVNGKLRRIRHRSKHIQFLTLPKAKPVLTSNQNENIPHWSDNVDINNLEFLMDYIWNDLSFADKVVALNATRKEQSSNE
jgi:hypothetical protein